MSLGARLIQFLTSFFGRLTLQVQLQTLAFSPWAGTLAMEIPFMLKVMDELLAAIPGLTEHAQISNVVLDCRHVLSDVLAILEGPGH